jgi:hypothetical protein
MSLPVVREGRIKLREQFPQSPARLAVMARKFTTPVITFGPPRKGDRLGEVLSYADWLQSACKVPAKVARRAKVQMFEESKPEAWRDVPGADDPR